MVKKILVAAHIRSCPNTTKRRCSVKVRSYTRRMSTKPRKRVTKCSNCADRQTPEDYERELLRIKSQIEYLTLSLQQYKANQDALLPELNTLHQSLQMLSETLYEDHSAFGKFLET